MKNLQIDDYNLFNEIDNIHEIFDPLKILKLQIKTIKNIEILKMFTNLRSLIIINDD